MVIEPPLLAAHIERKAGVCESERYRQGMHRQTALIPVHLKILIRIRVNRGQHGLRLHRLRTKNFFTAFHSRLSHCLVTVSSQFDVGQAHYSMS